MPTTTEFIPHIARRCHASESGSKLPHSKRWRVHPRPSQVHGPGSLIAEQVEEKQTYADMEREKAVFFESLIDALQFVARVLTEQCREKAVDKLRDAFLLVDTRR